jgi:uncharacterized membrane protein HdeD (DUF308 family)
MKAFLQRLLIRIVLLAGGCAALAVTVSINLNAGNEVIAGLLSPESPQAIAVAVARLLAPVPGLWMIYRALR